MSVNLGGDDMETETSYDEIKDVLSSFRELYKTSYDLFNQRAKNFVISPQQFYLMNLILQHDGINQRELAQMLKITPATLSVRIKRLEKAELLIRDVDLDDKRNFILKLTPQGKELIDRSYEHMKRNITLMFAGVTKEELASLKSCLNKIQHNLNKKKEENHAKD